ncbi:MAG TPA: 3-oxoacyl-[acyl-carrier-protein] synthase III C-terminal domain-containing protein [Candidatus Limnocylindrales bacterium]|nr:3-oxoacyl-[acyl-carrier-protein] synthase III C-terminal domain-containing protein [Candidatus Limnocylindrales bacterium]
MVDVRPVGLRPVARVAGMGAALPDAVETVADIEARIERESGGRLPVPRGTLAAISGIETRHAVGSGEYASTLAAAAGRAALADAGVGLADVDLLLFASTSSDQVEPATVHNVADAIAYRGGSAFDVKNACNSFVEGVRVAEAMLASGAARRVLVVTGETPTLAARYAVPDRRAFRHAFIGYTVGDAGGAFVLEPSDGDRGVFYRHSWNASEHWAVSQVPGGGSRHPRGDDHLYAGGDGGALRDIVRAFDPAIATRVFEATGTTPDDFALFVVHQVTAPFADEMTERLGLPPGRVERTIETFGNVASATLPLALVRAREAGRVGPGDNVLFVGLGAGISVATMAIRL